ncbi:hypothetical protein L6452_46998 [Arctium lappa]|nr:hypothetical protein L6452_46998 [Arctium lappa]
MWRYPSTASFLEGLWPFRPRKFEAITGPGKSLKFHRDGDRSLQLLVLNEEFLESPLTDARLVVVVKAFVSSRADAREALSNDPNVSSCNDASTATPADGGRRCVPVGCGTARAGPPIDSGRGPVRIGAAAKPGLLICPWRCVASIVVGSTRRHGVPRHLRAPGTGLRAPHSARLETRTQGV